MWKPGAPKPVTSKTDASDSSTSDLGSSTMAMETSSEPNQHIQTSTNGGSSISPTIGRNHQGTKRKLLSTATMGMRFMQRSKAHAEAAAAVLKQIAMTTTTTTNPSTLEPHHSVHYSVEKEDDETMQDCSTTRQENHQPQRTRFQDDKGKDGHQRSNNQTPSPLPQPFAEAATASDIYGVKADMIGRRSFGGFHKDVEEAYKSSWQAWKTGQVSAKKEINALSDEELLKRYQELVTNRGGGGRGATDDADDYTKACGRSDSKQSRPIGNLKQQQNRNSNGGKRKR